MQAPWLIGNFIALSRLLTALAEDKLLPEKIGVLDKTGMDDFHKKRFDAELKQPGVRIASVNGQPVSGPKQNM